MRRGVALDYVFCNLGGRPHQMEALQIAKRLCDLWQHALAALSCDRFDPVSPEISASVDNASGESS
ncbi:MAG: hypothetical protein R3F21_09850 [Myxococcota bacterium]